MTAPVAEHAAPTQPFRRRLLDGLAASIEERGYRETTVADIVRCARTSKRTFYDYFPTKEACFVELLSANNEELVATLRDVNGVNGAENMRNKIWVTENSTQKVLRINKESFDEKIYTKGRPWAPRKKKIK